MNSTPERRFAFTSILTSLMFILVGCKGDERPNVSLKALELFCADAVNASTCRVEESDPVFEPLTQWPHLSIVLFEDEFTVNGSHVWLPGEGGDCDFDNQYDPANYRINTNGGLYYRTVRDLNGDGIADPALTTISENELTPIPSPIPPQNTGSCTDIVVSLLCAKNITATR